MASGFYSPETTELFLNPHIAKGKLQREIVSNNIYGVDINEESVKITKFVIFLKIAQQDISFPMLNENIKSGNSIVSDNSIVANAFEWDNEFPFSNNGFDIIIGNPPWGATMKDFENYLKEEYADIAIGHYDSYHVFVFHDIKKLLKDGGILGYVIPNSLCLGENSLPSREYLLEYKILKIINLGFGIFYKATEASMIFLLKKKKLNQDEIMDCRNNVQILVGLKEDEKKHLLNRELNLFTIIRKRSYYRSLTDFKSNDNLIFDIFSNNLDRQIKKIIKENNFKHFSTYFYNGRGIDTNRMGKLFICPKCGFLNIPFGKGIAGKILKKQCQGKVSEDDDSSDSDESSVSVEQCDFIFERKNTENYIYERIISDSDYPTPGFNAPGYIGEDLQRLFFKRKPRAFKYYGNDLKNPKYAKYSGISWGKDHLYHGDKIVFRKIKKLTVPVIMVHEGYLVGNEQVYFFTKKDNIKEFSIYFYLGLLASRLIHYYNLKELSDQDKRTLPHFTQSMIKSIPVPPINERNDDYLRLIRLIKRLIKIIEIFNANPPLSFGDVLLMFPKIDTDSFNDFARSLGRGNAEYPAPSIRRTDMERDFIIKKRDDWLEIYGTKKTMEEVLVFRFKIVSAPKMIFIYEYLKAIEKFPWQGGAWERFQTIKIPRYHRDNSKNDEFIEEIVWCYTGRKYRRFSLKSRINLLFSKIDQVVFRLYNIKRGKFKKRIIEEANNKGFRII
jgi:hypothetical protein